MKTYLTVAMVIVFGSMALTSCERKNKVAAAGEDSDTYQPLPAQDPGLKPGDLIQGEIRKVDIGNMMMVIRLENGMDQTLKLAKDTQVVITDVGPNGIPLDLKKLATQNGSDVVIQWREEGGTKVATSIDVTHQMQKRVKRQR
jgi:hypothetical protein